MKVFPIIKCTEVACNLRCEYCFYRYIDQSIHPDSVMSEAVLEQLTRQLLEINGATCSFLWHGGEPLIAGIDFFRRALALQEKYNRDGVRIVNSVQTNGTMINKKWAFFFRENGFRIGVSIDGPPHIQDRYRKTVGGTGSSNSVMRGIKACQEEGLRVGAIAVVTSYSAQFPEDMYYFFIENGIMTFAFNPVFEVDKEGKLCEYSVSDEQFADFLGRILELWLKDDNPEVIIRQFNEPLVGLIGGNQSSCIYSGMCSKFLDIYPNGQVRPCHSFHGEASVLGNILQDNLEDILSSDRYHKFDSYTFNLHQDCVQCRWLPVCHGGCTDHRNMVIEGKRHEKYIYCGSRKRVFGRLEEVIAEFEIANRSKTQAGAQK